MLTKSNYLKYLQCTRYAWLYKNRKDLIPEVDDDLQRVFDMGYEIEGYAYKLFSDGVDVGDGDIKEQIEKTKPLMVEKTPVIFQPTISGKGLFCRADIIRYRKELDAWDIIEVKSGTSVKGIHIDDLAFQKACFEENGYKVANFSVIYLDNTYVRKGAIESEKMLKEDDVTKKVNGRSESTEENIKKALTTIKKKDEPQVKILRQCQNPYECPFIPYCWKDFPDDSIYEIGGPLGAGGIEELIDQDIIRTCDIPEGLYTAGKVKRHLDAVKDDVILIDKNKIKENLSRISYPIYYLDYETFGAAIPLLDGFGPYESVSFQYSLHIQEEKDGPLEHYVFLAKEFGDPSAKMAASLKKVIGKKGTIIAWNMSFEKGCNEEMGERAPEYKEFFEDVNERMYDLMEIFRKGYYVDQKFLCSASLKKVLPAMVPELSYDDLDINQGMAASYAWSDMVTKDMKQEEKDKIYNDLLEYCEQDTLAMVKILEKLYQIS